MNSPYTTPKLYDIPFPDLLTLIAQQNPRRPLVQLIKEHLDVPSDSLKLTWEEVFEHAEHAALGLRNRWAESYEDEEGKLQISRRRNPGSHPVVVGVLGNNGYELYVNIIACILNRWTVLLLSPEDGLAEIEHLLRTSKCSLFLTEPTWNLKFGRTMEQAIPGLTTQTIATLDPPATRMVLSPLASTTQDHLKKEMEIPAFYFRTSGSIGCPQIVAWSHEFILSGIRARQRERKEWIGLPVYCIPAIVHVVGAIVHFIWTPGQGNLLTFFSPLTPKILSAVSLMTHLPFIMGSLVIVPSFVLQELHSIGSEAIKKVAQDTELVTFVGEPLNAAMGNALVAAGVNLTAGYFSSEINFATRHLFNKNPEDWNYVYFREGYTWHFLPYKDNSNLKELIVGPGTDGRPALINNEKPYGYRTNDIWEPHPTVSNLWKYHSRKGDVVYSVTTRTQGTSKSTSE